MLLVVISIVPLCLMAVTASMSEQDQALETARAKLVNQTQLRATTQLQFLDGVRNVLSTTARVTPIRQLDVAACNAFLRSINEELPRYAHIGFADANGVSVCRSVPNHGVASVADRQYFVRAAYAHRFSIGGYIVGRSHGRPAIGFGLPVFLPGGELHGVQYAVVDLGTVEEQYAALAARNGMVEALTDGDGIVLASAGGSALRPGARLPNGLLPRVPSTPQQIEIGKTVDDRGREWLYAAQSVVPERATGAVIVLSMLSTDDVLSPLRERLQRTLSVLLLTAIVVSLIAWRIGDRLLVAPIKRLQSKIQKLESEGLDAESSVDAEVPRIRELRRVHRGLDNLALALAIQASDWCETMQELEKQKNAFEASERRYRAQFEASPQPMWVFDTETLAFLVVNDAAVIHYGYSKEEFAAMTLLDIRPPEDIPNLLKSLVKSRSESHDGIFTRHRRKSGEIIFIEAATHVLDWDGRPGCVAIIYDVTSREMAKQAWQDLNQTLEQQVAQRTRELELANEELDAFSYSVSHDLRGPLHIIDGFCAALLDKHRGTLPAQASHYLERIRAGTQQMTKLITDLLTLAKTGRTQLVVSDVDLASVAARIVSALRQRDPEREVSVDIERPLHAVCDPGLIEVALENLIGNAWKFTSRTSQAVIRVARVASKDGETDTFVVSDNGVGFDPTHVAKLFKPFQRLHSTTEFEGTGIGLATVHRIVRRHGGDVQAESSPGAGASFYFTLPSRTGS